MREWREAWEKAHGLIPKGWVVHSLNGDRGDVRKENLAAVPRYPEHLRQITAPYTKRIRDLEKQLKLQKES